MSASIIIVSYNGIGYLEDCFRSLSTEIKYGDEIILVDNASSDGSDEMARRCWPRIKLIRNQANAGFAAGCNQGAREATGEFLVFLNQDTRVCPGWLSALLEPLQQSPPAGLATSKLLLMSQPDQINLCGQEIHYTGLTFSRGFQEPSPMYCEPTTVAAVSGASFAIRKQLWEHLGGFDESFFMYYEETDLCWRAYLSGYTCFYVPASVAYHDQSMQPSRNALSYSARNRLILLFKHWKWFTLSLLLPGILLAEIVDWGYMLINGKIGLLAKLNAYLWICGHFPLVLKARRTVQRLRRKPDWFLLERCQAHLSPSLRTGGVIGYFVIWLFNLAFYLNYSLVLRFARRFQL